MSGNINTYKIINQDINNSELHETKVEISTIFIDPPYEIIRLDHILEKIKNLSDLNHRSLIVIESHKKTILKNIKGYQLFIEKIFGKTKVSFLQLNST